MQLKPLGDTIIIEADREESHGDIAIPELYERDSMAGTVVSVGPGKKYKDGNRILPEVEPGDRVLVNRLSGQIANIDGKQLKILDQRDVIAVLKKKSLSDWQPRGNWMLCRKCVAADRIGGDWVMGGIIVTDMTADNTQWMEIVAAGPQCTDIDGATGMIYSPEFSDDLVRVVTKKGPHDGLWALRESSMVSRVVAQP